MPVYLEFELLERFDPANMSVTYYDNRGDFGGDLSILRLVLVFVGLSSNVIVATVLAGNRKMHTAPNCYVLSIVTSDFIVLGDVLWNVLIRWFKFSLRIDGSYVACMTMEASMITIVVFTLERYDALCSPRADRHQAFRFVNGLRSLLIIWSMAATFPALELNLNLHFLPDTQALIFIMSTTMFLLVPTLVILALVGFILFDTRNLKNDVDHDVSKVFVTLAAVFYVSMAPYRMVSLVRFVSPTLCCSQTVLNGSYLIVELSAAVNPILYGFVSEHFRTALKESLRSFCATSRRSDDQNLRL